MEIDEVGRHDSHVLLEANLPVQAHRVGLQAGPVVSYHVSVRSLLRALDLVTESLQA